MNKNNFGFTLMELLLVISIIGILSGIIVTNISSSRAKARDAKRVTDLKSLQTAAELYANQHGGQFPTTLNSLVPDYIPQMPADPGGKCKGGTCEYKLSNTLCKGETDNPIFHYSLTARLEKDTGLPSCSTDGRSGKYYIIEQ